MVISAGGVSAHGAYTPPWEQRQNIPPDPEADTPSPREQNGQDRSKKHYPPATSFAGGNNNRFSRLAEVISYVTAGNVWQ